MWVYVLVLVVVESAEEIRNCDSLEYVRIGKTAWHILCIKTITNWNLPVPLEVARIRY